MSEFAFEGLPFEEAIKFFRDKLNITTEHWDDLWKGMHTRAFTVAGATKADLLMDLRNAVDMAIATGSTIADFRKDFDSAVQKYGWAYKGSRGWRTDVIFNTNLRTAYSAGRYKQMQDPDVKKLRPYWQYRHGDSLVPRQQHLAWDGKVLPADDPWWKTHYPPNGWGCSCYVVTLSERDLKRLGKSGPDNAPKDGTYKYTDRDGKTHTIPKGIDPGWDYNVGENFEFSPDFAKYPEQLREQVKRETMEV
jgi:uncharacterized protein with gpF-like domain